MEAGEDQGTRAERDYCRESFDPLERGTCADRAGDLSAYDKGVS